MNNTTNPSFKLNRLFFPRIDGTFLQTPKSDQYNQAFRFHLQIVGSKNILLLFGVSLTSIEKTGDKPNAGLIAEVAAEIELSEDLKDVSSLKDIPLSANMLALLFPFLREKVNYFFSNNHIQLLLPPINTIGIVNDIKVGNGLDIIDLRNKNLDQSVVTQN